MVECLASGQEPENGIIFYLKGYQNGRLRSLCKENNFW